MKRYIGIEKGNMLLIFKENAFQSGGIELDDSASKLDIAKSEYVINTFTGKFIKNRKQKTGGYEKTKTAICPQGNRR